MPGVTVVDMGLCLLKSDFLSFNKKGRKKIAGRLLTPLVVFLSFSLIQKWRH